MARPAGDLACFASTATYCIAWLEVVYQNKSCSLDMVTRPFVTYVQLRLLPLRSSLSGPGSNDSNATSEGTPNIDANYPSDYPLTDC
jgi:hypothetical protein